MKRIYVIVEGASEREFVSRILAPYFGQVGLHISAIPMLKSGGGMGFSNLDHFRNNVRPLLYDQDQPIITTMVDLYHFPVHSGIPIEESELKNHYAQPDINARLSGLESVLSAVVQKIKPYSNFIPYIQKHEFEALLFSDAQVFDSEIKKSVESVQEIFPNPEDINSTADGHPAERLKRIFKDHQSKYVKGADAVDLVELTGIEAILGKCPRFRAWIEILIATAKEET